MTLSIVIPAFNEEAYLGPTLDSLRVAAAVLEARAGAAVETIVVDNNSRDRTASVARRRGATVVHEPVQLIARARNAGARRASGNVLVFLDADVIVPPEFLIRIHEAMSDPACVGGGVETAWRAERFSVRLHLWAWWLLVRLTGMVTGAAQFARREAFDQVGGYDERAWIGEDVDLVWRLGKLGRRTGRRIRRIREPPVRPSTRRFDKWPLWKILIWTNPLFLAVFRRWKTPWSGWYSRAVR
ncbi:MAG: glycosyltransferase [Acidobacteria bacterium]|nr:glycosyltransferase [Acidobacteriota bacterium]MYF15679.1 glycosyltransferase [Acidobacteriota bacterium]MYI95302.1 glycosyltransferase [Acidobacteriota bacterium]